MARPRNHSWELLNRVMTGELLTEADLSHLINDQIKEDLHLDYKDGDLLNRPKKAAATIREYLSAFANSDGGIPIIGIAETSGEPKTITGASAPGGGSLQEWASRALTEIAGYVYPYPRFQDVRCTDGKTVFAIATFRSPKLVPWVNEGKLTYSIRIGDQTLTVPEYLLADLTLGRRQYPDIHINKQAAHFRISSQELTSNEYPPLSRAVVFNFGLDLENNGYLWAEGIQTGLIYWGAGTRIQEDMRLGNQMRSFLDIQKPDQTFFGFPILMNQKRSIDHLAALNDVTWTHPNPMVLPISQWNTFQHYHCNATLYVIPKGFPVLWYQITIISKSPFSLEAGAPLGVEHQLPSRDRRTIDPGPHPPRQGSRQGSQPWQGWGDRDWQQTNTPQPTNKNLLPSRTLISRSPYIYTVATRPRRDHKSGVLHAWDAGAVGGSGVRVPRVILQGLATSS